MYFTGDGARRDEDGYYWITGRVDDVINVSGHRIGTAEVESALVGNTKVAEAAVVGYPHDIKGQGIYAYVTLKAGQHAVRRRCARSWSPGCARRSARSPRPTSSSGRPACPRRARARSCAASCARSPRTMSAISATRRRSPIPMVVDDLVKNRAQMNPTIQQLSADLAAGRTTSRKLTEEALARIEDPKGEGKRAFIKVWRQQALAAADASDRCARRVSSPRRSPASRSRSRTSATSPARPRCRLEGARRRAAGQGRCARGGAAARRRRGDRRQHQHERVRLLGRRLQPALRHAGQSRRPHARARAARRPAPPSRSADRMAVAALGTDTGGSVRIPAARLRHRGLQADGAARADRRRRAALDLARFDRPARQLGRMLRHRRRGVRRRADRVPEPMPLAGLRFARARSTS